MCKFFSFIAALTWCAVCCGQTVEFDASKAIALGRAAAESSKSEVLREIDDELARIKAIDKFKVDRQLKGPSYNEETKQWLFADRKMAKETAAKMKSDLYAKKKRVLNWPAWSTPILKHDELQPGQVGTLGSKPKFVPRSVGNTGTMAPLERGSVGAYRAAREADRAMDHERSPYQPASPFVYEVKGPNTFIGSVEGVAFLFRGISTAGLVTDKPAKLPELLVVDGTDTRTLSNGDSFSMFVLRPLTKDEQAKLDAAVAELTASETTVRTWTDSTGKHKIEAELIDLIDNVAHLKKQDGTVVKIPLQKLGTDDRKLAQELLGV